MNHLLVVSALESTSRNDLEVNNVLEKSSWEIVLEYYLKFSKYWTQEFLLGLNTSHKIIDGCSLFSTFTVGTYVLLSGHM
jgi:hypothetical protein